MYVQNARFLTSVQVSEIMTSQSITSLMLHKLQVSVYIPNIYKRREQVPIAHFFF